jgi:flagellar motor switch/type III secretory pathway protein FliN
MRMTDGMLSVVSLEKIADESVTVVLNGDFL